MTPKITDDIMRAVRQQPNGCLKVVGSNGEVCWVVTDTFMQSGVDGFIQNQVSAGLAQAEDGEVEPLDMEATISEARDKHLEQSDT